MTFQHQLTQALSIAGIKQAELARRVETTRTAVSNWCNGRTVPSAETIRKIASVLGVSASWLQFGEGDAPKEISLPSAQKEVRCKDVDRVVLLEEQANRTLTPPFLILEKEGKNEPVHSLEIGDTISIPLVPYDVEPGEPKRLISMVRLPSALVRGRTGTIDVDHLELLWVDFNDMHKTMRQGSAALLDKSVKSIERDGVYAMQIGRSKTVRHVQRISDTELRLFCDHDHFKPIEIDESKVAAIGKVIAVIDMKPV